MSDRKIHILDVEQEPNSGSGVEVLCGKELPFIPIAAMWDDGRICEECLEKHRKIVGDPGLKTFTIIDPDPA